MKTILEPHRVKMIEPIRMTDRNEREYLIEAVRYVWDRRDGIRGMRIVSAPQFLRHFTAHFEQV